MGIPPSLPRADCSLWKHGAEHWRAAVLARGSARVPYTTACLGGTLGLPGGYPGAAWGVPWGCLGGTLGLPGGYPGAALGGLEKVGFFGCQFWVFLAFFLLFQMGKRVFGEISKVLSKKGYRGREKKCPRYPFFATAPPLGQLWKVRKMS